MRGALSYNEQKVRQGIAELILGSHFGTDISELGFSAKLNRFEQLINNSTKISTNTLHISLNFPPEENLNDEILQNIALTYMQQIGFGKQPFLVYRHDDTAHPHIHIITTPILTNGKTINIHNIAKLKSEPARKAIEDEFHLIKAEGRKKENRLTLWPANIKAAKYGEAETLQTVSNIVTAVVWRYKYSSFEELNAVLRQYNIVADQGPGNSFQRQNRGLLYSIVDDEGYKVGRSIKASDINLSPVITILERRFAQNKVYKDGWKELLKKEIKILLQSSNNSTQFMMLLNKKKIDCTVNRDRFGTIREIFFVDHRSRSIFNSEELGYSIHELLSRLNHTQIRQTANFQVRVNDRSKESDGSTKDPFLESASLEILKTLFSTETNQQDLSPEFFKKKRKKKKL